MRLFDQKLWMVRGALIVWGTGLPLCGESGAGFVGAQACTKCHARAHYQWTESRHARMLQRATEHTVAGDFGQSQVVLRGSSYLLRHDSRGYSITESDPAGNRREHRVAYTLGNRRIQQYLSLLPDGRIILLPAVWDNIRKRWVHDLDIHNPEEAAGAEAQVWNKSCFSCHVSGARKNFDQEQLGYHTTWQDSGVNCERCHGPGAAHVARSSAGMINPARLDAARSSMVCAQCHSLRDTYADGFQAGASYYDYFVPVMQYRLPPSGDPAYWVDGRPRWFANEALALWQSACFLKGNATCVTCHSQPHNMDLERNARLRAGSNALCTGCHAVVGAKVAAHTHHAVNSPGSSCVECHMPPTVTGIGARIRDHSLSIPAPENTALYGIPNACNVCHKDKDADWALRQMNAWYGNKSRQKLILRATAFGAAQESDPAAIPKLLEILSDRSGGPLIRANAAGFLGNFPNDPAAYAAVLNSFSDSEPLVRATAVMSLRPRAAQREAAAPGMIALLKDPAATVRMNAAIALVAMGVRQLPGEDGERFERAKSLYRARAALDSDDAAQQFAAGKFAYLSADMDAAVTAFRATLKLDPSMPAQYYLAAALAEKDEVQPAREILAAIPRTDLQYDSAQRLLAKLELKGAESGDAQALFRQAQLQYRNGDWAPALSQFEQALRLAPQAEWAVQARILRAICLEKLARTSEAEAAIQGLSSVAVARGDVELQLAFVELLYETGRAELALERADELIAAVRDAPMAHFWRAKILLQLGRSGPAAAAAEESIRLQPDLPAAHNLLIRIYQLQGRSREAAQQAQWMRDYQRRLEAR